MAIDVEYQICTRQLSKALHLLILIFLLATIACPLSHARKEQIVELRPWSDALTYAEHYLPKSGTLVQKGDGYAYLKVDDGYIHDLFPKLHLDRAFKKPPYFRRSDAPGAHISVVYENEHVILKEIGQKFKFAIKGINVVQTNKNTSYVVLEVTALDLEKLRSRYGLSPKLNGHEFHITIAKKSNKNL
jgi:hypothetical protein